MEVWKETSVSPFNPAVRRHSVHTRGARQSTRLEGKEPVRRSRSVYGTAAREHVWSHCHTLGLGTRYVDCGVLESTWREVRGVLRQHSVDHRVEACGFIGSLLEHLRCSAQCVMNHHYCPPACLQPCSNASALASKAQANTWALTSKVQARRA